MSAQSVHDEVGSAAGALGPGLLAATPVGMEIVDYMGQCDIGVTMRLKGVDIMEQLPAMKRARSSMEVSRGADSAVALFCWQVCLEPGWTHVGPAGNVEGGATWIDLEGSWKAALELLYCSTQSFGDDIWEVVKALGPEAWPRAQMQKLNHPQIEYIHAPPGIRMNGDIYQRNTVSGTERTVRRLWLNFGSLHGVVRASEVVARPLTSAPVVVPVAVAALAKTLVVSPCS